MISTTSCGLRCSSFFCGNLSTCWKLEMLRAPLIPLWAFSSSEVFEQLSQHTRLHIEHHVAASASRTPHSPLSVYTLQEFVDHERSKRFPEGRSLEGLFVFTNNLWTLTFEDSVIHINWVECDLEFHFHHSGRVMR